MAGHAVEEGGNQPQRVLLIGGPKHGDFINLPEGQTEYDFTSSLTLMGGQSSWGKFPENATHRYRFDQTLTSGARQWGIATRCNLFAHEVLWGSPFGGGFNLYALSEAQKDLEKAHEGLKRSTDALSNANARADRLDGSLRDFQERYEKLLDIVRERDERIAAIHEYLELLRIGLKAAQSA